MSIKLEMTFASFSDLSAFVEKQEGITPKTLKAAVKALPPVEREALILPDSKKVVGFNAEGKGVVVEEGTAQPEPEPENENETPPTYEQVKNAILEINKLKGKDAAVSVLKKFGAEKVGPQLKETDYPAILAECRRIKG